MNLFMKQYKLYILINLCLIIEIIRPHSRPFLSSTWYRPLTFFQDIFYGLETLVDKIDSEHKEFCREIYIATCCAIGQIIIFRRI